MLVYQRQIEWMTVLLDAIAVPVVVPMGIT